MEEKWKDIIGFEGLYQISNLGRIKSLYKNIIRKPQEGKNGYLFFTVHKNKKIYNMSVHREVAKHFLEYKENMEVNHIDGNKKNNIVTNLEWVTKSENQRHAVETGLRKTGDFVNTFNMKPVLCYKASDNSFVGEFDSTKRAALTLGLDPSTITKILKNKKKTTKGYKFTYKV